MPAIPDTEAARSCSPARSGASPEGWWAPCWADSSMPRSRPGRPSTSGAELDPSLLAAVQRAQDDALVADDGAVVRVGEEHVEEVLHGAAVLVHPRQPAVRGAQDRARVAHDRARVGVG